MKTPSFACGIEPLELRIAPALVTSAVIGGVLTIAPVNADTAFDIDIIQTGARAFQLVDGASTTTFNAVFGIKVTGSSGADTIDLRSGGPAEFHGDISIRGTGGADVIGVRLDRSLHGDLEIKTAGAASQVTLAGAGRLRGEVFVAGSDPEATVRLEGNVRAIATSGVGIVELGPVAVVHGGATFRAGSLDSIQVSSDYTVLPTRTINGPLTIVGGSGGDHIEVPTNVRGPLTILTGGGDDWIDISGVKIRGSATVATGAGNDGVDIIGSEMGGDTRVDLGSGNNNVELESEFSGQFELRGGAGDDRVDFDFATFHGRARFDLGDGFNDSDMQVAEFHGGLEYAGGAGRDLFSGEELTVSGSTRLHLGEGDNIVSFQEMTFAGALRTFAGSGDDNFIIAEDNHFLGSVSVAFGDGDNRFGFNDGDGSSFEQGLFYVGGSGADRLSLGALSATIYGSLIFLGGDGNNTLILGANFGNILSSLQYFGGSGQDTVLLAGDSLGAAHISISLGAGDDTLETATDGFSRFTADGGSGTDTLRSTIADPIGFVATRFEIIS